LIHIGYIAYDILVEKEESMLKKIVEVTLIAILVTGVAGAYFKWVGALPISVTSTQKMSTFDVTGEGKIVVVPDEATINLGVSEEGYSLKKVQEQVNAKMKRLSESLKQLGVDEKDIKTTGYNYYPDYQENNKYRAHANITVKIRDLDKASEALDLVSTLGLDSVSGPYFGLSDELNNKSVKEAREMAIEKAKAKASELAGLSGMSLGRIVNVSEGFDRSANYMVREMAPMALDSTGMGKTETPVGREVARW